MNNSNSKSAAPTTKTEKEHLVRSLKGDKPDQELHSEQNVIADKNAAGKSAVEISDSKGAVEQERDSTWRDYAGYERKSESSRTEDKSGGQVAQQIEKQETPG